MSRRKRQHIFGLVLAAVIGLAVAAMVVVKVVLARPLAGEVKHDFGVVLYDAPPLVLEHTFELSNQSDSTVRITKLAASCGCTTADPSRDVIAPGESVELLTQLSLSRSGSKKTNVRLFLDIDGKETVQTLFVEGTARPRQTLVAPESRPPSDRIVVGLATLVFENDDRPSEPQIDAPAAYTATFGGWNQKTYRDRGRARPARWEGAVKLVLTADAHPAEPVVHIRMSDDQHVTVRLDGDPEETGRRRLNFSRGAESDAPGSQPAEPPDGR